MNCFNQIKIMNKIANILTIAPLSSVMIGAVTAVGFAAFMAGTAAVMLDGSILTLPAGIRTSALFLGLGFIAAVITSLNLSRISVWNVTEQVLPMWFSITILMAVAFLAFRLEYSTVFLGITWPAGLIMLIVMGRLLSDRSRLVIGVLPGVDTSIIEGHQVVELDGSDVPEGKLDLVIATRRGMEDAKFAGMLSALVGKKVPVLPAQSYREQISGRVDQNHVDAGDLMQLRRYRRYMMIKRLSDIIMASLGLIIFSPLMVTVAVLIRVETSGPAIFVQKRVGEGGREFRMYKFRSMIKDAEKSGAKFATAVDDTRITRLGHVIRKLRVDELPQLINVVTGSMSMIGPRPEQKAFADDLEKQIPLYPIRYAVRPGITGWAQVMYGPANDVSSSDARLSYDLFYIKNLSWMMDMVIFFKTIKTIFTGFGAR
jgi:lipopolysaccharide/colanic/teichoic acid biosynthesis glycosyltransferase